VAALAAHHTMVERQSFARVSLALKNKVDNWWGMLPSGQREFIISLGTQQEALERRADSRRKRAFSELSQLCQLPTFDERLNDRTKEERTPHFWQNEPNSSRGGKHQRWENHTRTLKNRVDNWVYVIVG
jgi:hypothetical protein